MASTRRTFLNKSAIITTGIAAIPQWLYSENKREINHHNGQWYDPNLYDLNLSPDPYYGFKLQNDILGVRLWGPNNQPTLTIGKSDIWDRRWFARRQPSITMAKIKDFAMTGRIKEICPSNDITVYDIYNKYDFPCPKTGGQLIFGVPFATDTRFKANEDGSVRMLITGKKKKLILEIWVALMHSLIVIECFTEGLEEEDFWVRSYRHQDTIRPGEKINSTYGDVVMPDDFDQLAMPESYDKSDCWGIKQKFISESTFNEGFEYSLLSTCISTIPKIEKSNKEHNLGTPLWAENEGRINHGLVKRYTPINEALGSAITARFNHVPKQFTILSLVHTTQDNDGQISKAVDYLNKVKKAGIQALHNEQKKALEDGKRKDLAYANVDKLKLSASPFVFPNIRKKGGYYGDIPICSVDNTKFCFQDSSPWHGDFHFNELRAEPLLTLGQFEDVYLYAETIHTMLAGAMENARDIYDLPGAMYTLAHFPLRTRGLAHTNLTWEQDFGLNGLISKPLWLYYKYTGDTEFLKDIAYPVIRECTRFMQAYLSEDENGYLHIFPTVSPEHWGITDKFERNNDCTSAITMTRYLLRAAVEASSILGTDATEAAIWAKSLGRIIDFPIYQTEKGPIWVDVAGAPPISYNIPVPLSPIFWGDEVGLDSPPKVLSLARRTLEKINIPGPHYGYLNSCIRPRLGIWVAENVKSINPENLLQSYQSIHIFPSVPPTGAIIMENFAAEGGFRVSAKRTSNGEIYDVSINSKLGGMCRIANPWKGNTIKIKSCKKSISHKIDETGIIKFSTDKDATYQICQL